MANISTELISNGSTANNSTTSAIDTLVSASSAFKISVSVVLSIIIFIAIVGNSFVITAFCLRARLRKPSNFFILNLAVTDFSLAILILPISAVYDVAGNWMFGAEVCLIWTVLDVFISTASILSLVAISADRYMAISNSLLYPKMVTGKRVAMVIGVIYFISLTISIPPVLGWRKLHYEPGICYLPYSTGYVIYSAIGSFYLPFIIMSILYCKIYKVAKSHMRSIKKRSVVGSLLDLDEGREGRSEMERSDSRALFFSDDRSVNRRLTSSSSGYSSSKPGQRFSQVSRSTADTLSCHPIGGSRYSLSKQDSSDTLVVPGQRSRSGYLFISPMSSRSSRSSGSVSDFDGTSLAVPRDSMRSSRSSSSSYGADMESDLIRDYFKQHLVIPRASYVSQTSSTNSRSKRSAMSRRLRRFLSERKAAKTVSIIVGAFVICWTPFSVVYLLNGLCKEECKVSDTAFKICFWLGYVNSVINPIIYSVYNKDMKSAFISILGPLCCGRYQRGLRRQTSTRSSASIGSFVSVAESDWHYGEGGAAAEESHSKSHDKHLPRQVRQSMPTASCPVQVYINEPRKSRAGSVVSWSMAALRGTLHDKLTELDRQSNGDDRSVHSDKSVILPAVSFSLGGGDEADTESQASTLERNYNQQNSSKSLRSGRRSSICTEDLTINKPPSPRNQRRRSSAIFLTPDGDGGWSNKYLPIERDFVRRSSKVPSLEDIQETLSQDTRRSSDETSNNVTRQNSLDQFKNPSFDGTSSANSTLQDSRKSSGIGNGNLGGLIDESTCQSVSGVTQQIPRSPTNHFEESLDSAPTTCSANSNCAGPELAIVSAHKEIQCVVPSYTPFPVQTVSCVPSSMMHSNAASPTEGIVVSLLQQEADSSCKTLCLSINSLPRQQINNIQIVLNSNPAPHMNETKDIEKEGDETLFSGSPQSLSTKSEEARLQKSSSDSCLLLGSHVTEQNSEKLPSGVKSLDRTCASVPERRKQYHMKKLYPDVSILDSPDEIAKPSTFKSAAFNTTADMPAGNGTELGNNLTVNSTSTISSLGLDGLFQPTVPEVAAEDSPGCDIMSAEMWSPVSGEEVQHIWRSKSEPSLRSISRMLNTTPTPQYTQYLQGFISNKGAFKRRDSVVSSINTEYTYDEVTPSIIGTEYEGHSQRGSVVSHNLDLMNEEATPSLCGTEYEGTCSQRSSLASTNDDSASNQGSEDDIMVPAIHVTETDDITTVIQASAKYPSPKSTLFKTASSDSMKPESVAENVLPASANHRASTNDGVCESEESSAEHKEMFKDLGKDIADRDSHSLTGCVPTSSNTRTADDWIADNSRTIQLLVNKYVQEILSKMMCDKSELVTKNDDVVLSTSAPIVSQQIEPTADSIDSTVDSTSAVGCSTKSITVTVDNEGDWV